MKSKLKALGVYQIIGGIIGIGLTINLISTLISIPKILFPLFFVAFSLFSYSIICGIIIFKSIKKGLRYSKINQILQVVHFMAFGYAYQYISGINFSIGLDLTESLNFKANLNLSAWQLNINTDDPNLIINLNLVALFLIIWIDKAKVATHKEEINKQLNNLGQDNFKNAEQRTEP